MGFHFILPWESRLVSLKMGIMAMPEGVYRASIRFKMTMDPRLKPAGLTILQTVQET